MYLSTMHAAMHKVFDIPVHLILIYTLGYISKQYATMRIIHTTHYIAVMHTSVYII